MRLFHSGFQRLRLHPMNKKMRRILLFLLLALPARLAAEAPGEMELARAVFLLMSDKGACATASLIGEGKLLTNYHVAEGVCPYGDCKGLRVQRSNRFGMQPVEELKLQKAVMTRASVALDLAIIEISPAPKGITPLALGATQELAAGAALTAVGFPACARLQQSSGAVTGLDQIHITTSLQGLYGSSGSPVFDQSGAVAAVVVQASSLGDAASAYLRGKPFPLRAVRASHVSDILLKPEGDAFRSEVRLLNTYYASEVLPKAGLDRLMPSMQFLTAAEGLRARLMKTSAAPAAAPLFMWFDAYLDGLPQLPKAPDKDDIERLLTAVNIEMNGPNQGLLSRVAPGELREALKSSGHTDAQIAALLAMVEAALRADFPGIQIEFVKYGACAALALAALAALWGLSLGVVFCRSRGGFLLRLFKTLLVGLLFWPLSFLLFLSRRHPAARDEEGPLEPPETGGPDTSSDWLT